MSDAWTDNDWRATLAASELLREDAEKERDGALKAQRRTIRDAARDKKRAEDAEEKAAKWERDYYAIVDGHTDAQFRAAWLEGESANLRVTTAEDKKYIDRLELELSELRAHNGKLLPPVDELDILGWFGSHSSTAIRRVITTAEQTIRGRMEDGVFE